VAKKVDLHLHSFLKLLAL